MDADSRGTPNVDVDTKSDIEPCIVLPRTPSAPKPYVVLSISFKQIILIILQLPYISSHQSPVLRGPRLAKGLLRRGPRACCRILFDYGVNIQELAKKYKKSEEYINRVVENDSPIPDNVDEDYASVDVEMREVYPPKVSRALYWKSEPKGGLLNFHRGNFSQGHGSPVRNLKEGAGCLSTDVLRSVRARRPLAHPK